MKPIHEASDMLLSRFRERGVAQVEGYNKFGYISETDNVVIVSRERGGNARVPSATIEKAIEVVGAPAPGPALVHADIGPVLFW